MFLYQVNIQTSLHGKIFATKFAGVPGWIMFTVDVLFKIFHHTCSIFTLITLQILTGVFSCIVFLEVIDILIKCSTFLTFYSITGVINSKVF